MMGMYVGASGAFVAGFMWLDKLGLAARYGVSIVARQDLFDMAYALISANGVPTPGSSVVNSLFFIQ